MVVQLRNLSTELSQGARALLIVVEVQIQLSCELSQSASALLIVVGVQIQLSSELSQSASTLFVVAEVQIQCCHLNSIRCKCTFNCSRGAETAVI